MYDGAQNCAGLLRPDGTVLERYEYTFDGQVKITDAAGTVIGASQVGWQQGFGLLYRDDESQLCYSLRRYYHPEFGRHIQEDPAGRWFDAPNRGNAYSYLSNGYGEGIDALGLKAKKDFCCGGQYTAFVYDTKPFDTRLRDYSSADIINGTAQSAGENGKANHRHKNGLSTLKKANKKAGYGEKDFAFQGLPNTDPNSKEPDKAGETEEQVKEKNRKTANEYKTWLEEVNKEGEPCLVGMVYMLHSYGVGDLATGQFPFGNLGKEGYGDWSDVPGGLKFLIALSCMPGQTEGIDEKAEDVVAPKECVDWGDDAEVSKEQTPPTAHGPSLVDKAKGIIEKHKKK